MQPRPVVAVLDQPWRLPARVRDVPHAVDGPQHGWLRLRLRAAATAYRVAARAAARDPSGAACSDDPAGSAGRDAPGRHATGATRRWRATGPTGLQRPAGAGHPARAVALALARLEPRAIVPAPLHARALEAGALDLTPWFADELPGA